MPVTTINADFTQRVVIETDKMPWVPSPQAHVERRMLDRIGGEVARATSLVRYAAGSTFPTHAHGLGEEFLVIDGVFSDEHGDYPAGTYVRNPPGSMHAPFTTPGCIIFVKLRQMRADERERIVIDTRAAEWQQTAENGLECISLYSSSSERAALERLAADAATEIDATRGAEILVTDGKLEIEGDVHGKGAWIRVPPGSSFSVASRSGATYWVKRGHLAPPIGLP